MSAIFSPIVSSPLMSMPGAASYDEYCSPSASRQRREPGCVLLGPPVANGAGRVDLAALVVEAVADLVADDRADRAIVHRRVRRRIEERRLQDAGREDDLVLEPAVVGVDRLPGSSPTSCGRPACRDPPAGRPTRSRARAARCRRDRRPRSRASNSRATCRDSRPSRPSSTSFSSAAFLVASPIQLLFWMRAAIAVFRLATRSFHHRLRLRREVAVDVGLAEQLAEAAVDLADARAASADAAPSRR